VNLYCTFQLLLISCVFHAGTVLAAEAVAPLAPTLQPRLGQPFRDNAVLQRDIKLPIWGETLPGAAVTVAFDGQTKTVRADEEGKWRVYLDPLEAVALESVHKSPAGKSMTITSERDGDKAVTELENLLVGDVWLCAGQSNMAGSLRRAGHPKNYPPGSVNDAHYPAFRLYSSSQDTWLVGSPETVVRCSRVAFFFARHVQREALIPMGLMVTAVGGSNIESWLMNQPPYPTGKNYSQLVAPLVGYGIRGAIWYQGESNQADGRDYQPKLESLITGWRKEWGQGDFPFHYVQLPGLNESSLDNPEGGDGRAEIRQAFVEALRLPNTGMAVTIDVGTPEEHPPNKYDTGIRLARSVLKGVYGQTNITACPLYKSHKVEGSKIRVSFSDDARNGLMIASKDGFAPPEPSPEAKLQWLAIQAKDGTWHWADGKIYGTELIVSAGGVEEPVAVRYAYTAQPLGYLLYNTDGMPVGPFTTSRY
jgi:sialate O-acetylesterase